MTTSHGDRALAFTIVQPPRELVASIDRPDIIVGETPAAGFAHAYEALDLHPESLQLPAMPT